MPGMPKSRRMRHQHMARVQPDTGLAVLIAAGIGAGIMYLFDPARGRKRRRLIAERLTSLADRAGDSLKSTTRDLAGQARAAAAENRRPFLTDEIDEEEGVRARAHNGDHEPYLSSPNGRMLP